MMNTLSTKSDLLLPAWKQSYMYLAKGLWTPRRDGSGPRLPIDRMPFGLLSYNIRYFALDKINNILSDLHYVQWETTMFSNLGTSGFAYRGDLDLLLIMLREKNLQNQKLFQCHFLCTIYSVCALAQDNCIK